MKQINQKGAVSLITVVLFATIITIIVSAYARIAVDQQRQSITYDLNARAYYAAESGVQDAVRAISAGTATTKNTCQPLVGGNGDLGNGKSYSCQLINVTPADLIGKASPSITAQIPLQPTDLSGPFNYTIVLYWSKVDTTSTQLFGRSSATKQFPPLDSWGDTHAAPRLAIIDYPKQNPTPVTQHVYYLNPVKDTLVPASSPSINSPSSPQANDDPAIVTNSRCKTSWTAVDYACSQTINLNNFDLNHQQVVIRIGALYSLTDFRLVVNHIVAGVPVPLNFANSQATVDVTGRSGSVYQRVRQAVPISYTEDTNLDAALVGGDGICKHFEVGTAAADFKEHCPVSAHP